MSESVLVIGCGKMGGIILDAIIRNKLFENVYAVEPNEEACKKLAGKYPKVKVSKTIPDMANISSLMVFLCVKPHLIIDVVKDLNPKVMENTTAVSIAAGVTLDAIQRHTKLKCVRVMPNTPCQVNEGYCLISCDKNIPEASIQKVTQVCASMGRVSVVDEKLMDSATAISGSGPGLIMVMLEAMATAGLLHGIPKQTALEMAAQTMLGTAKLVLESDQPIGTLRDEVCTPGGCTIAGIVSLEQEGVPGSIMKSISKTIEAAKGLGN